MAEAWARRKEQTASREHQSKGLEVEPRPEEPGEGELARRETLLAALLAVLVVLAALELAATAV